MGVDGDEGPPFNDPVVAKDTITGVCRRTRRGVSPEHLMIIRIHTASNTMDIRHINGISIGPTLRVPEETVNLLTADVESLSPIKNVETRRGQEVVQASKGSRRAWGSKAKLRHNLIDLEDNWRSNKLHAMYRKFPEDGDKITTI